MIYNGRINSSSSSSMLLQWTLLFEISIPAKDYVLCVLTLRTFVMPRIVQIKAMMFKPSAIPTGTLKNKMLDKLSTIQHEFDSPGNMRSILVLY
jgi:hypothetical protein